MSMLKRMWEEFEQKVDMFQNEKMEALLKERGKIEEELTREELITLGERVDRAVERKFKKETRELLTFQIQDTGK